MYRYEYEGLKHLTQLLFEKLSFPKDEAVSITDVLLSADLFGIESHGIQRLQMYANLIDLGVIKTGNRPEIVKETPLSAVIDSHEYMGQISSIMATDLAIKKAKQHGMSIVCVKMSNHFGIAGYYARKMALEGLVGICMTNSEAIMVPTFGRQAMLGSNPIAVSMPASPYPFFFDAATTVVPRGKLEVYIKNDDNIPNGWGVDSKGSISTDPNTVNECIKDKKGGGILPLGGISETFGGHKGYGLGLVVELFTGILSGGLTSDQIRVTLDKEASSHMFMAIDYAMFGDKEEIEKSFSDYLKRIRESDKAIGSEKIYTHGEKEMLAYDDRIKHGIIVNEKTRDEIIHLCGRFGIDSSPFLKESVYSRITSK